VTFASRRIATVVVAGCTALSVGLTGMASAAPHHAAHHASKSHKIKKGKTTLAVNVPNYLAITGAGISVTPSGKAKQSGTNVTFPVTGGKVNPKKLTGTVNQKGGLTLSNGTTTVVMKNVKANLKKKIGYASVTGKGKHFAALKLTKPTSVKSTKKGATFTGYTVTLSKKAVAYLDKAFSTTIFKSHAQLGTATTKVTYKK
jgi:hypothetical protein